MIAYLDCFSGAAGDMLLAALLDVGVDLKDLRMLLSSMTLIRGEWDISMSYALKGSGRIRANHVKVSSKFAHRPVRLTGSETIVPDHDHALTCSVNENSQSNCHNHSHEHSHSQSHSHSHTHEDHAEERNFDRVSDIIRNSDLPDEVKSKSIAVFRELAIAESRVHGCSFDEIHFHEVGAIDSIIDTVGVILALHLLGVSEVYCSQVPMSSGTVWCQHGHMPVPAPATMLLMRGMETCAAPPGASGVHATYIFHLSTML